LIAMADKLKLAVVLVAAHCTAGQRLVERP
jgi:hypothetical protein